MSYKVYYSFLHRNEFPYLADEYKLYRQDVQAGSTGGFYYVDSMPALTTGNPVTITGIDLVPSCDIVYNYKVSAYNSQGEIDCINPILSGINFPCPPSPTPTSTNTPTVTPSITTTPSVTPSITTTSSVTPTVSSSAVINPSPTATPTNTVTPTITPSITITPTVTPTISITSTPNKSNTPTPTVTQSITTTPSVTPSITATASVTPSITATASVTPSITATASVTPSITATASVTPSITPSITVSSSSQPSAPSSTPTPTITATPSVTPTITTTPSVTPTTTVSVSPTATATPSVTVSSSPAQGFNEFAEILKLDGSSGIDPANSDSLSAGGISWAIEWPVGATKFSIDAVPESPVSTSTVSGGVNESNQGPLTRTDFGGLASYSSYYPAWAELNPSDNSPVSTDTTELPLAFYAGLTEYGIYDFGLIDCEGDPFCANGKRVAEISKSDQPNGKIHFFAQVIQDGATLPQGLDILSNAFEIQFSGRWK